MTSIVLCSVLIYFFAHIAGGAEIKNPCGDDSWVPYKDEKCVKLFKTFETRQGAEEACKRERLSTDPFAPSLLSIRSLDEQKFVTEYIFKSSDSNHIWIGAERRLESSTEFVWNDGSPVQRFTYWATDRPTDDARRSCVYMHSPLSSRQVSDLRWIDGSCTTANWFICEKLQAWPIERFQHTILSIRRELQYKVESITKENADLLQIINDLRNNLTAQAATTATHSTTLATHSSTLATHSTTLTAHSTTLSTQTASLATHSTNLTTQDTQLRNWQENPVPIGFVYVQLAGEPEPHSLWTTVRWTEITSTYAGLFFRAAGGTAATFGAIQAESSPRLTNVRRGITSTVSDWTDITPGAWSHHVSTGAAISGSHSVLNFLVNSAEVRPRNQAVRIWRRIH